MKVLLVVEQCDPDGMSVPLLGYEFAEQVSRFADVTLVTRAKYEKNLIGRCSAQNMVFIADSYLAERYGAFLSRYTLKRSINWPLLHALKYPLYAEFNRSVYRHFAPAVRSGQFDLVHAITPMIPRYPVKLAKACGSTPFVLGPVNGGLPFPKGFGNVARREYSHFNILRAFVRLLPGYQRTYDSAAAILHGSAYTGQMLHELLGVPSEQLVSFPENGIHEQRIHGREAPTNPGPLQLLFVGRLVPYKGAHLILRAMLKTPANCCLTLVGDGPERQALEALTDSLGLRERVQFKGWVSQKETHGFYQKADVFCFPSLREFGGAVVLEAMAHGLPSIIVDNGGIGEYLTPAEGIKIQAQSEEQVIDAIVSAIDKLAKSPSECADMSLSALKRAQAYTWQSKGKELKKLYESLCSVLRTDQGL